MLGAAEEQDADTSECKGQQDDHEQHGQSNCIKPVFELELDNATSATDDKKDETDR